MLKRDSKLKGTEAFERDEDTNNDILTFNILHGIDFSDLDLESKDKLIDEICKRILKLEQDKNE